MQQEENTPKSCFHRASSPVMQELICGSNWHLFVTSPLLLASSRGQVLSQHGDGTGNKDKEVKGLRVSSREEYVAWKTGKGQVTLPLLFQYLAWSSLKLYFIVHSKDDPSEHPNPSSLAPSTLMTSTSTVPLLAPLANPGLSVPITTPTWALTLMCRHSYVHSLSSSQLSYPRSRCTTSSASSQHLSFLTLSLSVPTNVLTFSIQTSNLRPITSKPLLFVPWSSPPRKIPV